MKKNFCVTITAVLVLLVLSLMVQGQTTAFSYQGKLTDGSNPANGNYDLQFKLFDALSDGNQIGATITNATVAVTDGVFTVELDFGAAAFDGTPRYLEICVRPVGSTNPYTVLSPRQTITSTPYAMHSANSTAADGLSSACAGCVTDTHIQTVDGGKITGNIAGSQISGTVPVESMPTGSGNYIQNATTQLRLGKTSLQQAASFNIDGDGVIGGNLGIGTSTPTSKVEIAGAQDGLKISGFQPFLTLQDTNSNGLRGIVQSADGHIGFVPNSFIGTGNSAMIIRNTTGNVGIGTAFPSSKVEIVAQDGLKITGFQPFITLRDSNAANKSGFVQSLNGDIFLVTNSRAALVVHDVNGRVDVRSLQIVGGSDFAESFDVSDSQIQSGKDSSARIQPGMVVSIDPKNPGKLLLSNRVYDPRVAGIISGAGGLQPGVMMGQQSSVADGKYPVALSGRVWVHCDAARRPVRPGDLLTTSEIPGHAMKVINYRKAQGAIIGKAMTGLKSGRGLVLVLVSLQ